MSLLGAALLQLAVLAITFVPLERAFGARAQRVLRPQWATDLAFFGGQHLVWLGVQASALTLAFHAAHPISAPSSLRAELAALPWPCQLILALAAGDFLVYWYHRLSHRVPLLWTFHKVHHSAEHLDWLAAHREHPVDGFLTQLFLNLPIALLGFSMPHMAAVAAFRGMWAVFIHSNVRLPIGPLRWLLGAPELHHWHHVAAPRTEHNFSNLAPWLDLVFGTYHRPRAQDFDVGLAHETRAPYWRWILAPHRVTGKERRAPDP